jgi:glycosyltransferase involved in cell wall biosynthesis
VSYDQLVSVIVPVYRRAHCVADAIRSVLDQDHPAVECVVVDDGSDDGTYETVLETFGGDERVGVFRQAHRGVSAARNRGLREAHGRFVTFLDSDDVMPPHRVRRQLELLVERDVDAVIGRLLTVPPMPAWLQARPSWHNGYCWTSILTATRHVRAVGGFDDSLHMGEDGDLLVRLRLAGVRIAAVDETFLRRRYFGDNLTQEGVTPGLPLSPAIRRALARRRVTHHA